MGRHPWAQGVGFMRSVVVLVGGRVPSAHADVCNLSAGYLASFGAAVEAKGRVTKLDAA